MSWLAQQDCELLRTWARTSPVPLLASEAQGKILWCNEAFEEFIGYSQYELTLGQSGNGMTWMQLSTNDGNLVADQRMTEELVAGRRERYSVKKQYLPKNERPAWVEIHVMRWPFTGNIQCFLVIVEPLKNGSQASAQIASETMSRVITKLDEIKAEHKAALIDHVDKVKQEMVPKSGVHQIFAGFADLAVRNPRAAVVVAIVFSLLIGGSSLLSAINNAKELIGLPVQTKDVGEQK